MKSEFFAVAVPVSILLLLGLVMRAGNDDVGNQQPVAAKTSSAADCIGVMGSLDRSFPGPEYNNPKPGTFYMPPIVWATASHEDKKVVAQLLALQVGCEFGTDPLNATVEIRSINDNRLLAKGPIWNLEEQ